MPNHVHVLIEVFEGFLLDKIVQSWKSFSALEANKLLKAYLGDFGILTISTVLFVMKNTLAPIVQYIHNNPVKAGLVDSAELWPFSSAKLWP